MNVFTAVGCSARFGSEEISWFGRNRILPTLLRAKTTAGIDNPQLTLLELFSTDSCVSLCSLTVSFLLLYSALRQEVLDLRNVSSFFSRDVARYKTTLCKLYQIVLILSTLDITIRHCNVCEIKLLPPFTKLLRENQEVRPLSIQSLLNQDVMTEKCIQKRRTEFLKFPIPHGIQ
jgi:hypothetical protein